MEKVLVADGGGVEPPRHCAQLFSRESPSPIGLPIHNLQIPCFVRGHIERTDQFTLHRACLQVVS